MNSVWLVAIKREGKINRIESSWETEDKAKERRDGLLEYYGETGPGFYFGPVEYEVIQVSHEQGLHDFKS